MKTKNLETLPLESLPGYTVDDSLDPGIAELTTYIPGQASPITVRGDAELLREDFRRQVAAEAKRPAAKPAVAVVEIPRTAPEPKDEYIDFSTLEPAQVRRRKISAWLYDRKHGTSMLTLFNEKLADDRDAAFAERLGLLTVGDTFCRKHQKAVAKLRGMDLTR